MSDQPRSSYAGVIADAQQTVTLTETIISLVGNYVSTTYKNKRATEEFRERLGEWADEALDPDRNGKWRQPCLRIEKFEKHMIQHDGQFKPSGKCTSSFAWAQLLYALDIRPGNNIVEWKTISITAPDPVESGQISLEVDGSVLCHIVNLFRYYSDPDPNEFERPLARVDLGFGKLVVKPENNEVEENQLGV
ncbi:hypothetical protein GL218_01081 [Daldinia childiae]|uniref:uncharacterized protein n=1 Tax=Daldinia childiae TaxID=326645 RepID=UPI0014466506|nr:uncharacterized protein GL218_01081 [Daldinia childiae]KAF3065201.1 hypothetical protein GL218_01081 [Daldinia childiae]